MNRRGYRRGLAVLAVAVLGSCSGNSGSSRDASGSGGSAGQGGSGGHSTGGGAGAPDGAGGAGGIGAAGNAGGGGEGAAGGKGGAAGAAANGGAPAVGGHGGVGGTAGGTGGAGGKGAGGVGGAAGGNGGAGGKAGAAGAGAGGGTGGAGGNSGGAGGASACESPCTLTSPQCGCGAGQACTLVGTNRQCAAPGTATEGQACSASVPCSSGLFCLAMSASISTCAKFCSGDADCTAPFGLCNKTVGDGLGGTIPGVKLCAENCDPVTNTGCPVPGTSCQDGSEFTISYQPLTDCTPAGTKAEAAPCNPTLNECAPGFGCFFNASNQSVCFRYCDNHSPCGSGQQCGTLPAGPGGNLTTGYGICFDLTTGSA